MNNDLEQFSEERLMKLSEYDCAGAEEVCSLARIALAAKQANPVVDIEPLATAIMKTIDAETDKFHSAYTLSELRIAIVKTLSSLTTPQPAHTEQDGWIKCSDDLPLIGVEVQVYIPSNAQTGRPTVTAMARFVNRQGAPDYFWDKSTGKGGITLDTSVTHWRPLAAAPKPESE